MPRGTVDSEFATWPSDLDALELETIIWLPDEHLARLLDPSADRWRDD